MTASAARTLDREIIIRCRGLEEIHRPEITTSFTKMSSV
jgi:hypothetical protein